MNSSLPTVPELLAPAGSFEKLVTAVHYGADAVYLSGKQYGLRAKATNFDDEGIIQAVDFAHERGVKVYVTVNIIAHGDDFDGLEDYLLSLNEAGVDAIIVSDPGIFELAKLCVPGLPIHLSTQANVTNPYSAEFWIKQGASRLNLARELSIDEIRAIRKLLNGEIEVFVHGALCISYSGRCMLSSYMTGRDANRGSCAHPCRYSYALVEEKRPGEYFPVFEDDRGTYIFNSRDLCLLKNLPQLVAAGVNSLKIEGRMKSIFYVGGVVRVYRAALDYLQGLEPERWEEPELIELPEIFVEEIEKTGTRGMSGNFIFDRPGAADMLYDESRLAQMYEPVAVVKEITPDGADVELRNICSVGDDVEYMGTSLDPVHTVITRMLNSNGESVFRGNPGNRLHWQFQGLPESIEINGMFRRKK